MPGLNGTHLHTLINTEELDRALAILREPGQVVEVRALEASLQLNARYKETLGGYFDNAPDLINAVQTIREAMGIYITLQPCHPDILHRAKNKLVRQKKETSTPDKYITGYRWLLIDSDPERVSSISSTDEEHQRALAHSRFVAEELRTLGWPAPIEADSSNGAHLLYRIDLAASESALVKRVLEGVATRFNQDTVQIDRTVYNPARICKLYGTLACKGDNTAERPHRMSRLLQVPPALEVVSRELLEAMATLVIPTLPARVVPISSKKRRVIDLAVWIAQHQIETYGPEPYEDGTRWVLKTCPWDAAHTDRSAVVIQFANGAISASCRHNSCHGKKWQDMRAHYEPKATARPEGDRVPTTKEASEQVAPEEPQALKLVALAHEECHVFSTSKGERYARVMVNGHVETWPINDGSFKRWLINRYLTVYTSIPQATALTSALSVLESQAQFGGSKQQEVFLRLAGTHDRIYLDLCNEDCEAVEISATGWKVIAIPPVCFRRPQAMLPLPRPIHGGSLEELKDFINVESEDWILLKAWILGAFHPTGPYPILSLHGEHGTAKSTTTRVLRSLIDPCKAPLRKDPQDDQTFAIMAYNNYVVALDNLSRLPARLSDNMCTLATGSGDAYRTLYTDTGETIFDACRPQVFNGIEELATRGDLIDRCMTIKLSEIPSGARRDERSYWCAFEQAHPRILGAILDAVSASLRNLATTTVTELPRMADFALWVQAAEPLLTATPGEFLHAYRRNKEEGVIAEIENSPVGMAILDLMKDEGEWCSAPSDLDKRLKELVGEEVARKKTWPQSPNKLSGMLKRLAPSLRMQQIFVTIGSSNGHRYIKICAGKPQISYDPVGGSDDSVTIPAHPPTVSQSPSTSTSSKDSDDPVGCSDDTVTREKECIVTAQSRSTGSPSRDSDDSDDRIGSLSLQTQQHICTTRWEKRKKDGHAALATHFGAGYWWCDQCEPQRTWMELGQRLHYPQSGTSTAGFLVKQGIEEWLRFAQEAGYMLVKRALEAIQEQEENS